MKFLYSILLLLFCYIGRSQNLTLSQKFQYLENLYDLPGDKSDSSYKEKAIRLSLSGNSYNLMNLRKTLGGLNEMVYATNNETFISDEINIINNLILSSKVSKNIPNNKYKYPDNYRGWTATATNERNTTSLNNEVPLFESYSFFYVCQFLYYLKKSDWILKSNKNKIWWENTLNFMERNLWTKWYDRSLKPKGNHYWYFLRGHTSMGALWAGIAMYLHAMTSNDSIKAQTLLAQNQYDLLLRRNLKLIDGAYIWNATYDNVKGTYASESPKPIIQDVSHGNHVVAYIIAAYEFGNPKWKLSDIKSLCNTVKKIIYDKKENKFHDNVDGTPDYSRPGWGNFVGDGWVKLGYYDSEVFEIFKKFETSPFLQKYNQVLIFKSNMIHNEGSPYNK